MQTGVRVARLQTLQQHSLRPSHIVRSSLAAPLLQRGLAGTARPASATHPASPGMLCKVESVPCSAPCCPHAQGQTSSSSPWCLRSHSQ